MRKIAVLAGGNSSEFEISVKSAKAVCEALEGLYETYLVYIKGIDWYWEDENEMAVAINKNDFSLSLVDRRIRFDAAFIAIHGTPGEDGLLQGYLEMMHIPYTSCSPFCSGLTFNKHACKVFLKEYNIPLAKSIVIRRGEKINKKSIADVTGLPCFVKPNESGSSFGVSRVETQEEIEPALEKAFKEGDEVLIESILDGIEVGCGILKTAKKEYILPVTEIIPKSLFFDYEAKYTPGAAEEITPARLPSATYSKVQELSSEIYDVLSCSGVVRVDFIVVNNTPFFLEINTVPGMTTESIIPKQIAAYGITSTVFYSEIIESLF